MTQRFQRAAFAIGCALLWFFAARGAGAFCQATTCDPRKGACSTNAQGCFTSGLPLAWLSNCVTVSVQGDGSPKQHIDFDAARVSVEHAFAAWTSATCEGGSPSISVVVNGPVSCSQSEYNSDRANANIVIFREDTWPYAGGEDALGLTLIRFDPDTGAIWDSDIEVNAVDEPLSVGNPVAGSVDLASLLTHEAGHLLGLGHNVFDETATMFPGYHTGSIELRSLADDDIAGICEIYPPKRKPSSTSCEPRHGFSELCGDQQPASAPSTSNESDGGGCSHARASTQHPPLVFGFLAALWLFTVRRSRALRRRPRAATTPNNHHPRKQRFSPTRIAAASGSKHPR